VAAVVLSARTWISEEWANDAAPYGSGHNVTRRALLTELTASGDAVLEDGSVVEAVDAVIFCTGG